MLEKTESWLRVLKLPIKWEKTEAIDRSNIKALGSCLTWRIGVYIFTAVLTIFWAARIPRIPRIPRIGGTLG